MRSLRELKQCLKDDGIIIVKENVILSNSKWHDYAIDRMDHSVTRTENHLVGLFLEAGLKVGNKMDQTGFPNDLYPVVMYALVRNDG